MSIINLSNNYVRQENGKRYILKRPRFTLNVIITTTLILNVGAYMLPRFVLVHRDYCSCGQDYCDDIDCRCCFGIPYDGCHMSDNCANCA